MVYFNGEYLISFDVAKALHDIRYHEATMYHYVIDNNTGDVKVNTFGYPKRSIKLKDYKTINAPIQRILIREIENKFKLLVCINPFKTNFYKGQYLQHNKIVYAYSIYDLNDNKDKDWVIVDNVGKIDNAYETQEDAIDAGLLEVISLIKKQYQFWE